MSAHTHAVRRAVEQLKPASLSSRKQAARRPTIEHAAAPRRRSISDMRNRDVKTPNGARRRTRAQQTGSFTSRFRSYADRNRCQGRHRTPPHLWRGACAQPLQAEERSAPASTKGWTPQRVHHGRTSGLRNRVEGRVDAVWSLVPSLVPFLKSCSRARRRLTRGERCS